MQSNILYALVVIGAITAGTIGFANTLTVSAINPVGGNDGAIATTTAGTITAVTWTEISTLDGDIDLDSALVTVDNGDASAHTYEVCAVVSDGVSVTSGLVVCVTTALIAAGGNSVETLDLPTDVDTEAATQIYITLEELS